MADDALSLYVKLGARGLVVSLTDTGTVRVAPTERITPDLDTYIRTHRDALADLLQGDIWRYRRAAYGWLDRETQQEAS